jgi:hypothetical protein
VGKRARNFENIHGKEECGILTECSRAKNKNTEKKETERNTYYQRNEYVSEEVKKWKD